MTPSPIDLRLSVVSAMLEPALALARIANLSMDDVRELVSVGYFRTMQARGLSWEAAARRLGKSRRTIAALAKQATESTPLSGSEPLQVRRKMVRVLAQGRMSFTEIEEAIPRTKSAMLHREIEMLIDQGIVQEDDAQFSLTAELLDLLGDGLDQKLASLRHFLEVIGHVVYRRFYQPTNDKKGFARVLTFSVQKERLNELTQMIYEALEKSVFEADAEAERHEDAVQASVAFCVVETPDEREWR